MLPIPKFVRILREFWVYVEYHGNYYTTYVNFKIIENFKKYCERKILNLLKYMEYFFSKWKFPNKIIIQHWNVEFATISMFFFLQFIATSLRAMGLCESLMHFLKGFFGSNGHIFNMMKRKISQVVHPLEL
jgi:hypothetical protein